MASRIRQISTCMLNVDVCAAVSFCAILWLRENEKKTPKCLFYFVTWSKPTNKMCYTHIPGQSREAITMWHYTVYSRYPRESPLIHLCVILNGFDTLAVHFSVSPDSQRLLFFLILLFVGYKNFLLLLPPARTPSSDMFWHWNACLRSHILREALWISNSLKRPNKCVWVQSYNSHAFLPA